MGRLEWETEKIIPIIVCTTIENCGAQEVANDTQYTNTINSLIHKPMKLQVHLCFVMPGKGSRN